MIEPGGTKTAGYNARLADYFAELIAEFLSLPQPEVRARIEWELQEPGGLVGEAWRTADPRSPDEITRFYKTTDTYLFDLACDHCSSRRALVWNPALRRVERRGPRQNVLLYGDGIGTDSISIAGRGHRATYFGLPGRTSDFARFRFGRERLEDRITVITEPAEIPNASFDVVVCIEVLEHVSDPPSTMRGLYRALKSGGIALITESFASVGAAYPSHLPGNLKYAGRSHQMMEAFGFASTYYNADPINRPMEFTKKDPNLAGDLVRFKGRLRRALHTRWRHLTHWTNPS